MKPLEVTASLLEVQEAKKHVKIHLQSINSKNPNCGKHHRMNNMISFTNKLYHKKEGV